MNVIIIKTTQLLSYILLNKKMEKLLKYLNIVITWYFICHVKGWLQNIEGHIVFGISFFLVLSTPCLSFFSRFQYSFSSLNNINRNSFHETKKKPLQTITKTTKYTLDSIFLENSQLNAMMRFYLQTWKG